MTSKGTTALGSAFVISLATSVWSAGAGDQGDVRCVERRVWPEGAPGPSSRSTLVALLFTIGFLVVNRACCDPACRASPASWIALPGHSTDNRSVDRSLALPRTLPDVCYCAVYIASGRRRSKRRWRWLTPGSVFAALAWCARLDGLFVLCRQFWQLQCNLRVAWCSDRIDDVDLAVDRSHSAWRRIECAGRPIDRREAGRSALAFAWGLSAWCKRA